MLKIALALVGDWLAYISAMSGRPVHDGFGVVSVWPLEEARVTIPR